MESIATTTYEMSFLDILGVFPALLAFGAILLGFVCLICRRGAINIGIAHLLIAIACAGVGTTAWRIHEASFPFRSETGKVIDPMSWYTAFGIAWWPIGVVLPACGFGFSMVAFSWFLLGDHAGLSRKSEAEAGSSNGG